MDINRIKTVLKDHYHTGHVDVIPQQGGWAALAYKVFDDTHTYFLKVYEKSRTSTSKWTALIDHYLPVTIWLLQNSSLKDKIPVPILTKHGEYKCESEDAIYLLYQYINGETIGNRDLSEEQVCRLAEIMAELHSFGEEIPVKTEALMEDFSVPFLQQLRSTLDKDQCNDTMTTDVAEIIEPYAERIKYLMDTVEQLSARLKNGSLRMALCHTDIHNWNLMQSEGRLILIDWEGLKIAPVEADLMFLVDNPHYDAFLSTYLKFHKNYMINDDALKFYQVRRKLEDVWEFIEQLLFDKQDEQEKAETKNLLIKELKEINIYIS